MKTTSIHNYLTKKQSQIEELTRESQSGALKPEKLQEHIQRFQSSIQNKIRQAKWRKGIDQKIFPVTTSKKDPKVDQVKFYPLTQQKADACFESLRKISQFSDNSLTLNKLPRDMLATISSFAAAPNVPQISKAFRASFSQARAILWKEAEPQLRADPLIASYINAIDPALPSNEKFKRLYKLMRADAGICPGFLCGISRYSANFYLDLSSSMQQWQDIALECAWHCIRETLEEIPIILPIDLPLEDAEANEIRRFLNNPLALPLIQQVTHIKVGNHPLNDWRVCTIPKEIKLFTRLRSIDYSHNEIDVLPPNLLQGLTHLQHIDFSSNQIKVIPPQFLQGLTHLQHIDFSSNQIKVIPPQFLQGLTALQSVDFRYNLTEYKWERPSRCQQLMQSCALL